MAGAFIKTIKPYSGYLFTAWLILTTILTIIPSGESFNSKSVNIGIIEIRLDYLIHIVFYSAGSIILWIKLIPFPHYCLATTINIVILTITLLLVTVGLEFFQKAIPWRAFNINDILSNSIGVISGIFVMLVISRMSRV